MKRLEVSGALRPIYGSLGVKRLKTNVSQRTRSVRLGPVRFGSAFSVIEAQFFTDYHFLPLLHLWMLGYQVPLLYHSCLRWGFPCTPSCT